MTMVKLFPIILLAIILQGCHRSSPDQDQRIFANAKLTNSIFFSDSIGICNRRFSDAVTNYLKEPNNAEYRYFTLSLGQYKDTIISVLSPLWYDIGTERENPIGVLLVGNKSEILLFTRNP
jgi:hypothetical protein